METGKEILSMDIVGSGQGPEEENRRKGFGQSRNQKPKKEKNCQ